MKTAHDVHIGNGEIVQFVTAGPVPTTDEINRFIAAMDERRPGLFTQKKKKQLREVADQHRRAALPDTRVTVEELKMPFVMAGGTLGATAGVAATPIVGPGGPAAGGILGVGIGSAAHDTLADLGRRIGFVGPEGPIRDVPRRTSPFVRASQEMILEGIVPGTFGALGRAKRSLFQRLADIGEEGRRIMYEAEQIGVGLGIEHATERAWIRGYRKVIGRLPWVGTPLSRADKRISKELDRARNEMLNKIGPSASTAEMGVMMHSAAVRKYGNLKGAVKKLYDDAFELASSRKFTLRPNETRDAAAEIVNVLTERRPRYRVQFTTEEGETIEQLRRMPKPVKTKLMSFAKQLSEIEDTITLDQYKDLLDDLDDIMNLSRKQGLPFKKGFDLKKALERDLMSGSDQEVVEAYRHANRQFATLMRLTERPTARAFGRVDKHVFGPGFEEPGSLNADELFKTAFNADSPRAMSDLRKLVGPQMFRRAVRAHIDNAVDAAVLKTKEGHYLNLDEMRRNLGLQNKRSGEYAALSVALRNTGVSIKDLDRFMTVLETAAGQAPIDVSTFVARRTTLGGARAGVRALMPGATLAGAAGGVGATTGKLKTLAAGFLMAIGTRKLSRVISDPAALRAATQMLDPALSGANKRAAAARFFRLMGEEVFRDQPPQLTGLPVDVQQEAHRLRLQGREQMGRIPGFSP